MRRRLLIGMLCLPFLCGCPDDPRDREFYELVETFGKYGDSLGEFDAPMGLVSRRFGTGIGYRIFVADHNNGRVVILPRFEEMNQDSIRYLTAAPGGTSDTIWPVGVTVTQSNYYDVSAPVPDSMYVYVTDSRNHRVCKYGFDSDLRLSWGSYGSDTGQFISPTGIDIDFQGNIYVADSGNNRVQVFDTLGSFLRMWGDSGSSHGQFRGPIDVSVGFKGTAFSFLAVSDHGNNRVQFFDRSGSLLRIVKGVPGPVGVGYDGRYPMTCVLSSSTRNVYFIRASSTTAASYKLPGSMNPYDGFPGFGMDDITITDISRHQILAYLTTERY